MDKFCTRRINHMKKIIRLLALALIGVMFCGSFATIAYAKELELC